MTRLKCDKFESYLESYDAARSTLGPETKAPDHFEDCPDCKERFRLLSGFSDAMKELEIDPLPPLVERSVIVAATEATSDPFVQTGHNFTARHYGGFAFATAAAAALVLGLLGFFSSDNTVQSAPVPQKQIAAVSHEQPLPIPVTTVMADGRRMIPLDMHTDLWIDDDSVVSVETLTKKLVAVHLKRGRVLANIKTHPVGYRFVVATPSGEVEAKGTIFAVQVSRDGTGTARVMRGTVEVRGLVNNSAKPATLMVSAGETASIGGAMVTKIDSAVMAADRCLLEGCRETAPETSTNVALIPEPATTQPASNPGKSRSRSTHNAGGDDGAHETVGETLEKPSKNVDKGSNVALLLRQALKQRSEGQYESAASTYRKLITEYPHAAASSGALVSLGNLELSEIQNPSAAAIHFHSYLSNHSSGTLAQEARVGQVRAYAKLGRHAKLVAASNEYLKSHPGGYAGAEVTLHRAAAYKSSGNCSLAVKDYRKIRATWPASPQAERAAQGLTSCGEQP